jgi:DNA-binding NarL/FixJ family response regulator
MEGEQHGRRPAARQVRALIVDPHASFRCACKALLQTEGLAVVADLERYEGAGDIATALRPDIVLIDVSPDQTEGLELARRLSGHAEPPTIVLMSANPADAILTSSAGADLFLVKAGITAGAIAQAARKPGSSPSSCWRRRARSSLHRVSSPSTGREGFAGLEQRLEVRENMRPPAGD